MATTAVPGRETARETCCEALCSRLDEAVAGAPGDVAETTRRVEHVLRETIADGEVELPEALRRPMEGCYARRLVHRSDELGYTVLAMVWGVGQGTPLHDHCGMWCVEAVLEGTMEVVQYELMEERDGLFRFERRGSVIAGTGSAGSLIPPYDYHTMTNHSDQPSLSIHVYEGEMLRCSTFPPRGDGWHEHRARRLEYTS